MRPIAFTALFLNIALSACAGLDTRLPDISAPDLAAETDYQETEALRKIEANGTKLLNVGWPVLTANTELCPKTHLSIGIKAHSLKSYSKRLRSTAGRVLDADDTPRIFHIAKDSPAARAGLKRGDVILNAEGQPAALNGKDWDAQLAKNSLNIRRGEEDLNLTIIPVMTCDYNLRYSHSPAINAFADGRNITMMAGMMDFTKSDEELALIIGHELAHNTMGHVHKSIINYIITLGGTRYTRPFESEADYVGLYYMTRAGYSPEGVETFWQRLANIAPKSIHRAKTHPTFPDRYLRIKAAREEILAKQSASETLVPNFISGSDTSGS